MKLIFFFLFLCRLLQLQTEISEVFDKLHHVNGNDSAIEVSDTVDSSDSPPPAPPKLIVKDKPILRKLNNGVKTIINEDWNSMAQFEKFIKLEMENLAAAKNQQNQKSHATSPVSMSNILKPEKHVSVVC
jgi:hypothetical protein